jgi:hypothetical protein
VDQALSLRNSIKFRRLRYIKCMENKKLEESLDGNGFLRKWKNVTLCVLIVIEKSMLE